MPFEEPYRCESCACRTFEDEIAGECHAAKCWRTVLCGDCVFTCQYCRELFCEDHSIGISADDELKPRYACQACLARATKAA